MPEFSNLSINLTEIPDFKSVDLSQVNAKFRNILSIRFSIGLILASMAITLSIYFLSVPLWLSMATIAAALIVFSLIFVEFFIGFKYRQFGLRQLDIIYQSGYLVRTETIVPFNRIQHVEISQGLLMRYFNLYSLLIYTAGESSGDLNIAGLDLETAQKIKSKVLQEVEDE